MHAISEYHDRQKEHLLSLLVQSNHDFAMLLLDPAGLILTCNAAATEIYGYRPEEILGRHFSQLYPDQQVQQHPPARQLELAREQGRFEDEGWRERKDGTRFWANIVITPIFESGTLRAYSKVTRDLTQRREQEETLRHSEERFRLLVEGVHEYGDRKSTRLN